MMKLREGGGRGGVDLGSSSTTSHSARDKFSDKVFFYNPCELRNPNLPTKNSNMGPTFSSLDISRNI